MLLALGRYSVLISVPNRG